MNPYCDPDEIELAHTLYCDRDSEKGHTLQRKHLFWSIPHKYPDLIICLKASLSGTYLVIATHERILTEINSYRPILGQYPTFGAMDLIKLFP